MPLTRKVTFRRMLQRGNRVQIPKMIRWEFKLEPAQVLKVDFSVSDKFKGWQFFYAKMENEGKIFIPKVTLAPWQDEKDSPTSCVVEITLEPV